MAESLRDLVVSLSLNTDNFTRNIRSVQRQIQEAQSEFQLAAAGIQNFEQTTEGLTSRLTTLQRTLSLQADAVNQYEKALTAARDKLQECYDRQNDYAQRLEEAKQKQADLADQVTRAEAAYEGYKNTLGESDSATMAAKQALDLLKADYAAATAEVKKLEGQNEALKKSTQNAADAVSSANVKLNQANAAMRSTQSAIEQTNQELTLAQTQWKAAGEAINTANASIMSIGKKMQEAESRFKLATAGIKDMDSSTVSLAAKMTLLQEKITLQQQVITQYEAVLAAAKQQLEAAQQANDPTKIKQASDAVTDAQTKLNNARAALVSMEAELKKTNQQLATAKSKWTQAGKSLTEFGDKCSKLGQAMTNMGRTLTLYVTTPIATIATTAVKASMEFESAFTDVRKVTSATEEQFAELSNDIKQMSTELAASTTEIASVVTSASRLGIATEDLMNFTEVMINLGNSTNMTADDAATSIARFANIMGMSSDDYERLGSTLVALGNNYATTESEIMEMSLRLAGAGKQIGLSESEVLALSASLSALGIESQMGGSSMSKALIKMEVAAATGGQELDDFASVCGMTAGQFKTMWESDPTAVFQRFILGLAQMDEQGLSAIAVLNDIGISEMRLRDTILRATNATELFDDTQKTANSAWKAGTQLATVAEKRYSTTASKLTNLKNSATLFAQTIGDDLNPTIRKLIEGGQDLIKALLSMDSGSRMTVISLAAIAAAIGPAFLSIGKLSKAIGESSKVLGKLSTAAGQAIGNAGGGLKGLLSVVSKSPVVWVAAAVAAFALAATIIDVSTGATQTKKALEEMNKTAEDWKNTAASTFYSKQNGLSFFGMSTDDFRSSAKSEIQAAKDWMSGLIAVWTDGKPETNATIKEWIDSWKTLTNNTRETLTELQQRANTNGYTSLSSQLQADIDSLNAMDKEISRLLRNRQNRRLTDEDEARLQELVDQRNAILVKYRLIPEDEENAGFDAIRKKVEGEVARAQARGAVEVGVAVYENAVVAAAQGMAAVNDELNEQYDNEYALIQLMTNEAERQAALADLNSRYNTERKAAAMEYANLLKDIIMPVWNNDNMQQAGSQMDELLRKLRAYSVAGQSEKPALLTDLQQFTSTLDESTLTEYLTIMTQLQSLMDNGMSEAEIQAMFPDIDFSAGLDQFAGIAAYLSAIKTDLPALYSMFNTSLAEEVLTIATDLDMTGAQARWDTFAQNPGAITTNAVIESYTDGENATIVQHSVDVFISKYFTTDETNKTELTPTGLVAYVQSYAERTTGADVSGLTPEIATCFVAGYQELATGADVSKLTPDEIVAYITAYAEKTGVDISALTPEGITAFVVAYEEANGGASIAALSPDDVTAMVVNYLQAEGVDMSKLTPDQINAIVTSYSEATGCDKSQLLTNLVAYVTEYREANGVKYTSIKTRVVITGYDYLAYKELKDSKEHDFKLDVPIHLGELDSDEIDKYIQSNKIMFWQNGVQVPIELVPDGTITADTVAALSTDGTLHVFITPEVTGTKEAVEEISPLIDEVDSLNTTAFARAMGAQPLTQMDKISSAMKRMLSYQNMLQKSDWEKFWASIAGETTNFDILNQSMKYDFTAADVAALSAYVAEAVTAIQNGEELSEEDLTNLQNIVEFLSNLQELEIGGHIREGVAQGMTEAGWDSDAETVATNLETALNKSFVIRSPSKRVKPIGDYIAQGIGVGVAGYDFKTESEQMAGILESALRISISGISLQNAGLNIMRGLRIGIMAGRAGVISAMRSAAKAAVNAAKSELKIHSPSRVFRDEVGVMAMKGLGEGILEESKEQAAVIRNASRFLTGEAKEGSIAGGITTNTQTYHQDSSVNFTGSTFYIRDEKDVQSLAIEIATLTRRRQHGRGLRTI